MPSNLLSLTTSNLFISSSLDLASSGMNLWTVLRVVEVGFWRLWWWWLSWKALCFFWLESFREFGENGLILGKGWCRFCGIDMKFDD
jgi:hypothetical protein